jgi:hypothetical protein
MPLTKIQSLGITDGTIVNADINASAAIAGTKLGAGAVLQVVSATLAGSFSTSSASDQDTGLSATITPSSASNKILILLSTFLRAQTPSGNNFVYQKLWKGSVGGTLLIDAYPITGSGNTTDFRGVGSSTYLDSPNTTSSTTYIVSINAAFSTTVYISNTTTPSTITLIEIKG